MAIPGPHRTRTQDPRGFEAIDDHLIARASIPHVKQTMRQLIKAGTTQIPDTELQRIDVPTALVWGRHDRMAPLDHAQTRSTRRGWPMTIVDDAGHLPHVEQPDAFVTALTESTKGA